MRSENSIQKNSKSGILLLAKQSGETSFSSLTAVKKSLGTNKVGHTGTLDSFADGLLVVLTGSMTHLVPHITGFSKTYLALIEFGTETDTLDPTGKVIKEGPIPEEDQIRQALLKFRGEIEQIPPEFSALHVNGKRASDLMRSGVKVELKPRKITVHSIRLLDFEDKYALIEVSCSKGTYIRSLARDIARECGTAAHLKALRRTSVGPFNLKDAAGKADLSDFTISNLVYGNKKEAVDRRNNPEFTSQINKALYPMTPEIAQLCGFENALLSQAYVCDYLSGRPLKNHAFYYLENPAENTEFAVFYPDMSFGGVVKKQGRRLSYGFVIPWEKEQIKVYSWEQIVNKKFAPDFMEKGCALSIGSFDGTHIGHDSIFDELLSRKNLVPGIVTFRHPTKSINPKAGFQGEVSSLSQRMEFFISKGFRFVIVIDFSEQFTKIDGYDFLSALKNNCNVKFIAEGEDFRCGYKGATDIPALKSFCSQNEVELKVLSFIDYLDKKVSSSRIRQDVLDKEFEAIKNMLRRPYSIDCMGFDWKREEKDGQYWLVEKQRGTQVYPPDGEYTVTIEMVISGSEEISVTKTAVCKLDSGLLRVLDSDGSLRGFVRAIQFG
jgi:tRNA pseudouridine55 synthase